MKIWRREKSLRQDATAAVREILSDLVMGVSLVTNSKQLTEQAIAGELDGPVPVCAILGGSWPLFADGYALEEIIGDARKTAEIFHRVYERIGADLVTIGTGSTVLLIRALGGGIRFYRRNAPDVITEPVATREDIGKLDLTAVLKDSAIQWLGETAVQFAGLVQEQRFILTSGRGPFTLASQILGLENFLRALHKDPTLARELLEFTTRLSIAYYQLMNPHRLLPGALISDAMTSGDIISRKAFEEFALPYLTRVIAAIKQDYGRVIVHICGDITDRLPLLADSGADVISIDTKVSITAAKRAVGSRVCIAGNVDTVDVLEKGSPDQVRQATESCLAAGTTDSRFILMPGCDLAEGVQEENIRVMIETAHSWRGSASAQ